MKDKYFTTEQVANILQVHPFTILKFIKEGKLMGIKLGRMYRIKESDVEDFLERQMTGKAKKKVKEEDIEEIVETKNEVKESETYKVKHKDDDPGQEHYYII